MMLFSSENGPDEVRAGPMRQIPLDLGPTSVMGLDEFVQGRNAEALSWLRTWPEVDSLRSPAYFWGGPGSGKTHLLRAMIEPTLARGWGVIWLNAHTCQMWDAAAPALPTLALIDECEALDANHQHLAFNLFIESAASQAAQAAREQAPAQTSLLPGAAPDEDATGPLYIMAAGAVPAVDLPVRDDLRKASRGDKDASARIARWYIKGDSGLSKDTNRYEGWMQYAAELGNGSASLQFKNLL